MKILMQAKNWIEGNNPKNITKLINWLYIILVLSGINPFGFILLFKVRAFPLTGEEMTTLFSISTHVDRSNKFVAMSWEQWITLSSQDRHLTTSKNISQHNRGF